MATPANQSHPREATAKAPDVAGAGQLQQQVDEDNEKGYVGEVWDQTPNEVYSLPDPGYGAGEVAPEIGGRTIVDAFAREHDLGAKDPAESGPAGSSFATTTKPGRGDQRPAKQDTPKEAPAKGNK